MTVDGQDDLPVPEIGGRLWLEYVRCMSDHAIVIRTHDGACFRLRSGEWPDDGYCIERDPKTGKLDRTVRVAFEGHTAKGTANKGSGEPSHV